MSCRKPCDDGNQVPLTSASSETTPPMAGPMESTVSRCPSTMPERRERQQRHQRSGRSSRATRPAARLTPSEAPGDVEQAAIVEPAIA